MGRLLFPILALAVYSTAAIPVSQDSLRREVAGLSAQGKLEAALALVENSSLPPSTSNLLGGKLELRGDVSQKKFESVISDPDAAPAARGEALFRLGQLHYAAGQYRFAIPQFREYLTGYPKGAWADPAAYWMAYSCLQFSLVSHQKAYLDSGLKYLERFKSKKTSGDYYRPLALSAKARTLLTRGKRGDTATALTVLREAQHRSPAEEIPGIMLLAARALQHSNPDDGKEWEDSLLWDYPFSPEALLLSSSPKFKNILIPSSPKSKTQVSTPSAPSPRYTLQLGLFSVARNAEEMRKRLAAKKIVVRVEQVTSDGDRMYRVLYGDFPDAPSARQEGTRIFKRLAYAFQVAAVRP